MSKHRSQANVWQRQDGRTAAVLECVFSWLGARELVRCGGVSRAWRGAARGEALWRRALLPRASPQDLRALADTRHRNRHIGSWNIWSWVREGMLWMSRWERGPKLAPGACAGAALAHAALDSSCTRLAILTEDAHLSIWERSGSWRERWSGPTSAEWREAVSVQWAPRASRVLAAGALLLAERWELLVLHIDDDFRGKIICRTTCSMGTSSYWMDDDTFLTLRVQLLGPGQACTTVWLNAAAQETYSEHAGVVMPLLRIYNEAATNITHILIADTPTNPEETDVVDEERLGDNAPHASYFRCLRSGDCGRAKMLIAASGEAGGVRGSARALAGWAVPPALHVAPLRVREGLRDRVRLRQDRQRHDSPPPELPEAAVRALCTPPAAQCSLGGTVLGLTAHPNGACVWASSTAGLTCVSLPALRRVLHLPLLPHPPLLPHLPHPPHLQRPPHLPALRPPLYRLQPAVDDDYVVAPLGDGTGDVCVWTARGGQRVQQVLPHSGAALLALMPATLPPGAAGTPQSPRELLVLAGDAVHVWHSWIPDFEENVTCEISLQ